MENYKKYFSTVCCLLIFFINAIYAQDGFTLDAYVEGFSGKTRLIINKILPDHNPDLENEQVIEMIEGKFTLTGYVTQPTLYSIRIRPEVTENFDPRSFESVFIWIENKPMTLRAKKGRFKYADVSGSFIQDQNEESIRYIQNKMAARQHLKDSLAGIRHPSREVSEKLRLLNEKSNYDVTNEFNLDFAWQHPDNFIAVYNCAWYVKWLPALVPKTKAITFYESLNDSLQNSLYGRQIKNYIDNVNVFRELKAGDALYDFSLPDSTGKYMQLKAVTGKIILLDFWASGCGPCRMEHRNYLELYNKYKDHGFEIVSVNQDRFRERWIQAMQKDHMAWTSVWDKTAEVSTYMYLVQALPSNYLVNEKGIIIAKDVRGKALEEKLNEVFTIKN